MPKIQLLCQSKSGITYHRIINPLSYLDLPGWDKELLWFREDEWKIDCDVLVYNKFLFTDPHFIQTLQQDKGMKVIVDVDDYWELPLWHTNYNEWKKQGQAERILAHIKLADIVICTTMKLQDKVREYNKNTVVIPNAIPYGYENYKPAESPIQRDKMGFIYVAGSTHLPDVELLKGKFQRIGSDPYIKNNAEFILAGYEPSKAKQWMTYEDQKAQNSNFHLKKVPGVWDSMAAVFAQTGSHKILPTANLDEYIDYYDQADVSIIPLVQNEWNSCKSPLKIIEAATRELPCIVCKVQPYTELQDYPILWVEKPDDWITHIKWCLKNKEAAKDMGIQLSELCRRDFDLIKWNQVRTQVINSLI